MDGAASKTGRCGLDASSFTPFKTIYHHAFEKPIFSCHVKKNFIDPHKYIS